MRIELSRHWHGPLRKERLNWKILKSQFKRLIFVTTEDSSRLSLRNASEIDLKDLTRQSK